jgi:fructose PTS system EIIBC or EIIC component
VIAMLSSVGNRVAHGGPIVAVLGAVDNVVMFFIAVIVGVLVTAFMVIALKRNVEGEVAVAGAGTVGATATPVREEKVEQSAVSVTEIKKLTDITSEFLIETDLAGTTRDDVIDELIAKFDASGVLSSKEEFKQAILNREEQSSTGLGMSIAIPHGKSAAVKHPAVAFGIKTEGVDWNSLDGSSAKLIFMIAVPEKAAGDAHLKILQMLSRKLMDEEFRNQLLKTTTKAEAYKLLEDIQ